MPSTTEAQQTIQYVLNVAKQCVYVIIMAVKGMSCRVRYLGCDLVHVLMFAILGKLFSIPMPWFSHQLNGYNGNVYLMRFLLC